jgi:hypothetical protein
LTVGDACYAFSVDRRLSRRCQIVVRASSSGLPVDVDASKISDIPGFGKNLTDRLVIWRDMKEKAFIYNSAAIMLDRTPEIGSCRGCDVNTRLDDCDCHGSPGAQGGTEQGLIIVGPGIDLVGDKKGLELA